MLTHRTKNLILLGLGHLCVLLGFIGVFLPLLPTTPFILLATYFYSKSSQKFHAWLTNHKMFGQLISDWEKYGILSYKTKIISSSSLIILFGYTIIFLDIPNFAKIISSTCGLLILTFILTRPSKK